MGEGQDTEITLGTGRLLGLFFGLVIVCAIFFGLGFSMGRNSVKSTLTMEEAPAVTESTGGKVAAGTPQKTPAPDCVTPGGCGDQQQSAQPTVDSTIAQGVPTQSGNAAPTQMPELEKNMPLTTTGGAYTVQVAAVSKQEDADALVDALKKKSYPVFVASGATDKLFHVQIGPFGDIKDAESIKSKLVSDGYNPIVKR